MKEKHFFFEKKKQKTFAFWVACGGGSGAFPWAPGSAGSLVGLIIGLVLLKQSHILLLAGAIVATIGGYASIRKTLSAEQANADPGWIVIDEIAGQSLSMLALPHPTILGVLAAFALFRLFDITKPGPIGWADRRTGAAAIMADDLLAGLAAAGVVVLLHIFGRGWV
jgi:phosphatidylglycerophosphatase A